MLMYWKSKSHPPHTHKHFTACILLPLPIPFFLLSFMQIIHLRATRMVMLSTPVRLAMLFTCNYGMVEVVGEVQWLRDKLTNFVLAEIVAQIV